MRALAITGIDTAALMPSIISGSLIRATPPSRRMSAGTRSSAITAQAPASSAILACSGVTTSMMTPPFSISARPRLTGNVPVTRVRQLMASIVPTSAHGAGGRPVAAGAGARAAGSLIMSTPVVAGSSVGVVGQLDPGAARGRAGSALPSASNSVNGSVAVVALPRALDRTGRR